MIVQFWHDSADVPPDVSECLDSWRPLIECGFRRVLFDDDTASAFISKFLGSMHAAAFDCCRHPAMRCDYFRLCWMHLQGGFYVDADDWYLGANCDDLFVDGKPRSRVRPHREARTTAGHSLSEGALRRSSFGEVEAL